MKRFSGFVCLLHVMLLAQSGHGQFDALPDSNARWQTYFYDGPSFMDEQLLFSSNGADTLFNSTPYRKLMGSAGGGTDYAGAYRDDGTGKLFFRTTFDQTVLLYDFDVEVGDTVDVINVAIGSPNLDSISMHVVTVDTVVHAGRERKRIGVVQIYPGLVVGQAIHHWIEGIGGTGGLLTTCGCYTLSGSTELECMSANDTIQYGADEGQPGDCFQVQGLQELGNGRALGVYPNPNTGRFTVQFSDPLVAESYYSVYDAMGKLLYQRPLPKGRQTEEVDLSRFGAGTYVIRFTDKEGSCHERVVVE